MIHLKTPQEIKIMHEGGKRLGQVKAAIREMLAPGVIPCDIDRKAEELMEKAGGQPSFKKVRGYHWATCININDGVVHGVPSQIPFEEGDLVFAKVTPCMENGNLAICENMLFKIGVGTSEIYVFREKQNNKADMKKHFFIYLLIVKG